MIIGILAIATPLLVFWVVLLMMASQEDFMMPAYNKILDNRAAIEKMRVKSDINEEKLANYHGLVRVIMGQFYTTNYEKAIAKLEKQCQQVQSGNFKSVSIFDIPGYVLLHRKAEITQSKMYRSLLAKHNELFGKKYVEHRTQQLFARMISCAIGGVAVTLLLGAMVLASGNSDGGRIVMGVGTATVLVFAYALYDEVDSKAQKRHEAIARQIPNMLSKMALLVTSGMSINQAWKQTAFSQDQELYLEMQQTSRELENLVSPEMAYSEFMIRCNTKESTKVAAAILQSTSKGNSEIAILLQNMAKESWAERRSQAKKDAEMANSKLMIPTMLLLLSIMIMIMIPLTTSFTAM